MGAFVGANFDSVSRLNKELEEKEQELKNSKHDLVQAKARQIEEIQQLKNKYGEKLKWLQGHNDYLK